MDWISACGGVLYKIFQNNDGQGGLHDESEDWALIFNWLGKYVAAEALTDLFANGQSDAISRPVHVYTFNILGLGERDEQSF